MEPPTFHSKRSPDGETVLIFQGQWKTSQPLPPPDAATATLKGARQIRFDCRGLRGWDSALPVFLFTLLKPAADTITIDFSGLPDGVQTLLKLAFAVERTEPAREQPSRFPLLHKTGLKVIRLYREGGELAAFTGELVTALYQILRGRGGFRRQDLWFFIQECGANALPIVSLIALLVGVILGFVGAIQLQLFGAQIYVADLVGISMLLEMGAMMTGVIMAGRTGAAYAAQLGTMQVNEEIDALQTLGLSPVAYLVLPRMIALILMMPLLCLYADLLGIIGGAGIGIGMLDISPVSYLQQTQNALQLDHLVEGLIKATVYGFLVSFAGCLRGMQCGRSASAVGDATTSAVVTSIVLIVVSDAIMNVVIHFIKTVF
ncbi:ABC transporter permease [Desulfolithobacter dissulfuricans]|uniref:ABC transporter permease n=1 Tax=Desulfolithobacter dissulfuricans TaxID=2795293 RepID=A0A915U1I2_9BACT|nr:ABC transporter permease [Desulfolithobacter dissulfuricans]BCO09135.1 ABC transporter permease [Desulfolithobacter dissulfuricans]